MIKIGSWVRIIKCNKDNNKLGTVVSITKEGNYRILLKDNGIKTVVTLNELKEINLK